MSTILFIAIGVLLGIVLTFLVRHEVPDLADSDPPELERRQAIAFDPNLLARIFGSEDYRFVERLGSPDLYRQILQQRTALALSWISTLEGGVHQLMEAHRHEARQAPHLSLQTEFNVVTSYCMFLVSVKLLALFIRMRGPAELSDWIKRVDRLFVRLSESIQLPLVDASVVHALISLPKDPEERR